MSDVLKVDEKTGQMTIGGEKISDNELRSLKEEAGFIQRCRLWSIMTSTLKHQAHLSMFEKSKSFDDMVIGKTMLYNIDVQEKFLETFLKK